MRGEVYRLRAPRDGRGYEQSGARFAVVVQSDVLPLSTWLVAPTSTSARAATFRPEVDINGRATRVLAEQTAAVDPQRLVESIGRLTFEEQRRVDAALRIVLELWIFADFARTGCVRCTSEAVDADYYQKTLIK